MKVPYIYKKESEPVFVYTNSRIALKEYIDNMLFYQPCDTDKAEFAYYDKIPLVKGKVEYRGHGSFGGCINVQKPVEYSAKNFEALKEQGTIQFRAGIYKQEGYSTEDILLDRWVPPTEAGDYSFTLKVGRESVKPVTVFLEKDATSSDLLNAVLVALDPNIYKAEVSIKNLENITIQSSYPGEEIHISSGTEDTDLLSILNTGNVRFGCYPGEDQLLFSVGNNIIFTHKNVDNVSYLEAKMIQDDKETVLETQWNNNGVTLSAIELDYDYDVAYLFIDGELRAFGKTGFYRKNEGNVILGGTEDFPYLFDEIAVFSKITHTASFDIRKYQITKYVTNKPYIDFHWNGVDITANSIEQLTVNATPNIHFIIYSDNTAYYYLSGSWRESDGTFSQSNDQGTFISKLDTFIFNGADIVVRAIFNSDGSSPAYIDDIYFELSDESIFGDEDEAPAILVGKPQLDDPVDLYGKTLIIETDQGRTEIEFTGDLKIQKGDCCDDCPCNNTMVKIFESNEVTLITALDLITETRLYSHIMATQTIRVKRTLIVEKGAVLDMQGFELRGIDGNSTLTIRSDEVIVNGIPFEEGTYSWDDGGWFK